jgi:hypothetical protein
VSSTVTRSSAALMEEAAGSVRARKGLGRPFIGKRGEKDRHDEQGFGLRVLRGRRTTEARRRQRYRRAVLATRGRRGTRVRRQQGGARAVDGQEDDAWARARLEVAGGDQERSTVPAA